MNDDPHSDHQDAAADDDHPAYRTGRIRIVGAEPAAAAAGGAPGAGQDDDQSATATGRPLHAAAGHDLEDAPAEAGTHEGSVWFEPRTSQTDSGDAGQAAGEAAGADGGDAGDDDLTPEPALPHWSEAPTGEVPAVRLRSDADDAAGADDPWSSLPEPTWREETKDWDAAGEAFEPAVLGDEDSDLVSRGAAAASERTPWEFDLAGASPSSGSPTVRREDDDTLAIPFVNRDNAPGGPRSDAAVVVVSDRDGERGPVDPPTTALPSPGAGAPVSASAAAGDRSDDAADAADAAPAPLGLDEGIGRITLAEEDFDALDETERRRLTRGGLRGRRRTRPLPEVTDLPDEPVRIGGTGPPEPRAKAPAVSERPPAAAAAAAATSVHTPIGSARPVPQAPPGGRSTPLGRSGLRLPGAGVGAAANGGPPADATGGDRNLPVAVISGLGLFILLLIGAALGPPLALCVVIIIAFLATGELCSAFRRAGYQTATALCMVASVSILLAAYNKGLSAFPMVTILLVGAAFLWCILDVEPGADTARVMTSSVFVYGWVAVFAGFGGLLLSPALFPDHRGVAFLMGAVITGVANDVGSYAGGVVLGRHQLAPRVSPGKTIEGTLSGIACAVLFGAIILHFLHPWNTAKGALLGLVVALLATFGDLCESAIKRGFGLKDMGRMLPGHGGILDRVDGLLFALPATYYLVKAFHLG